MTIERRHFTEPVVVDILLPVAPQTLVALLLASQKQEIMEVGTHAVTPDQWTQNTHGYELAVQRNGRAEFLMKPVEYCVGTVDLVGNEPRYTPGERREEVSEVHPVVGLYGPIEGTNQTAVFDVFLYTPGPSPRQGRRETREAKGHRGQQRRKNGRRR